MHRAHEHDEVTAMIEWPQPLSAQALKVIKTVLLGVLVITALVQIVPFQLLGGLANNLFTIILILSWVGPARRFLRRRMEERNGERNEGPAAEEK
jgi:hypothetical protein